MATHNLTGDNNRKVAVNVIDIEIDVFKVNRNIISSDFSSIMKQTIIQNILKESE